MVFPEVINRENANAIIKPAKFHIGTKNHLINISGRAFGFTCKLNVLESKIT